MPTLKVRFNKNRQPGDRFRVLDRGHSAKNVRLTRTETIKWQLADNVVERGVKFSTTADKPGIVFVPTNGTPSPWPNSQPTGNETTWTVSDAVSANTAGTFAYTINVVTPGGTTYSTDPDVTNSPQGG